jgi:hypothetical protein
LKKIPIEGQEQLGRNFDVLFFEAGLLIFPATGGANENLCFAFSAAWR